MKKFERVCFAIIGFVLTALGGYIENQQERPDSIFLLLGGLVFIGVVTFVKPKEDDCESSLDDREAD